MIASAGRNLHFCNSYCRKDAAERLSGQDRQNPNAPEAIEARRRGKVASTLIQVSTPARKVF